MPGLDKPLSDTDAWATGAAQPFEALNEGFIKDQTLNTATGALTTNATFATATTFTVPGDATAFYVAGRRLRIVHAGGTTYCSVSSSAFAAGVTTVTIGTITQGPATMTTPITSVAVSPVFTGTPGNTISPTIAVQDEGVSTGAARGVLNFIGDGVKAVDNPGQVRVDVTVHGVPIGGTFLWPTDTAPTDFLLCYGQAISRTTYAALFALISTVFGVGDGSTTFNLPDMRGRVPVGQDDMGGVAANRITAANAIGVVGGASTHTLSTAEMPSHSHSHNHGSHSHTLNLNDNAGAGSLPYANAAVGSTSVGSNTYAVNSSTTPSADATGAGSSSAHNNVQPYLVWNYVMRAI